MVLACVTFPAKAHCVPVIRLLRHAGSGAYANMSNLNGGS
jgi:hypothetical protein